MTRSRALPPFASGNAANSIDDSLTLYQSLFQTAELLCKRYPALTPFSIRRERAREVFLLIRRINSHPRAEQGREVDAQGRIRVPAGDNWF